MQFKHSILATILVISILSCQNENTQGAVKIIKLKEEQEASEEKKLEGTAFRFVHKRASRKLFGSDLVKVLRTHCLYRGADGWDNDRFPYVTYYQDNKLLLKINANTPSFIGDIQVSSNGEYLYANTSADYSYSKPEIKLYPVQNGLLFGFRVEIEDRGQHVTTNTLTVHCNTECALGCVEEDSKIDLSKYSTEELPVDEN